MNLVTDPWIPVINRDGRHRLASLNDVFADGESIADLSANPCQRIALMRLLICIAQAALDGPADEAEWRACRPRLTPAALAYLKKWQHRFNLFGEHAFLQVDGLDTQPNALSDKIDLTLACGNNPTLFDHQATPDGRAHASDLIALNILVYQMFSPGGLVGTAQWEHAMTERTSEHSPCLEGSMLHTVLRRKNLGETVIYNMLTRKQISELPNMRWGVPCWESPTLSRERLNEQSMSYLGRLVSVSRAIRFDLHSTAIVLAAGTSYEKLPEQREPMGTVVEIGTGSARRLSYVAVNPNKHPWRELGSMVALQSVDKTGGALCLYHIRQGEAQTFDVWTGGLLADKAKLVDMVEWSMTVPVGLFDSLALARYRQGVETANQGRSALRAAIRIYAELQKSNPSCLAEAEKFYWTALDKHCAVLSNCATGEHDSLNMVWFPVVRDALFSAYSQVCPHETPRQIQAFAQGLKVLESWKGDRSHGT